MKTNVFFIALIGYFSIGCANSVNYPPENYVKMAMSASQPFWINKIAENIMLNENYDQWQRVGQYINTGATIADGVESLALKKLVAGADVSKSDLDEWVLQIKNDPILSENVKILAVTLGQAVFSVVKYYLDANTTDSGKYVIESLGYLRIATDYLDDTIKQALNQSIPTTASSNAVDENVPDFNWTLY